ncbi:MAG: aminopeptidase, partial [Bacteroidetes bacterium]|nr:aminopeptidase [Bacteroidota bacterium]
LDEVIKLQTNGKLSKHWFDGYKGILDAYLGKVPQDFMYDGNKYTPQTFLKYTGINPDDYIELTSFTHHPYYSQFVMEVADNWSHDRIFNVSLEDLSTIADDALKNGYSVEWASDVSEKGFSFKNGIALVPFKAWADMNDKEKDSIYNYPTEEPTITAQMRQDAFDNLSTQDDHGMHFIGIVKDQSGKTFYIVKNSWGTTNNDCDGLFYCSKNYYLYKTTAVLLNKNAVSKSILKKLGIN